MLIAFFTALAATVAAQAAPGPNLIAVASVALSQGRAAAFMVALGVATGVWLWVTLCIFGVALLFNRFPASVEVLRVIGGLYFLVMALRVFLNLNAAAKDSINPLKRRMSPTSAYRKRADSRHD